MRIRELAINADAGLIDGNLNILRRELDAFQELGFQFIELSPHGVDAIYNGRLHRGRMQELKSLLAEYPFRYTVHGPNPLNLMNKDPDNLERQIFLASIEFTAAIGSDILVYHAGRYWPEEKFLTVRPEQTKQERQQLWEQERLLLTNVAKVAASCQVTVAVENARPFLDAKNFCYAESLAELGRMVREVGQDNIGITLDVGHAYLAANTYGYDLTQAVRAIAPYVKHIHLHDNFGKCCYSYEKRQYELIAHGRGDMHMPIGWGSVPAETIFAQLPEYSGVITLELRPRYRAYYGETLENARRIIAQVYGGFAESRIASAM